MIKKVADKQTCPFCGRPSIDQCAMRDWAWYPCEWEKAMKGQQHDK